jgi:tol-pal system protein YbgF
MALAALGLALGLVGCATATPARPTATAQNDARMSALSAASDAQTQRIAELESRIALLEQEARRAKEPARPKETVRIGEHRRSEPDAEPSLEAGERRGAARTSSKNADESVAVIRLHEAAPLPSPDEGSASWVLPTAPAGVATSLEVVPLPDASGRSTAPADPTARYREALSLIKERRFDEALALLALFTRENPEHALTAQAIYWKGEAHYAARRYREALIELETFIRRFPTSSKVPDALLKAGLCNQRLGQAAHAERYFDQVRKDHPSSAAAQNAPREGSS